MVDLNEVSHLSYKEFEQRLANYGGIKDLDQTTIDCAYIYLLRKQDSLLITNVQILNEFITEAINSVP